jgi:ubiquinone/menaquinone biosynthesis C-methylase UbiE
VSEPYYKQHWVDIDSDRHAAYDQILAYHPAMEPLLAPLDLKPGLRVLDLGSGPGHTTLELARRVGSGGRVTGVDINAEFVARAGARAREQKLAAEFVQSAFPPLPFPDRSFDRVFCKNVLEYVDSAADTVAEMARVTKTGGIAVAVDSDWDMLALELPEPARELSERVLEASRSIAIKERKIGRRLYRLFRAAGFAEIKVNVLAGADTVGRSLPMLKASFARYALDSGKIAAAEVERWLDAVARAIAEGTFLFVLPQFVVRGTRQ